MTPEEITSRQTDFYQLRSELGKLIPRVNVIEISEEQAAIQSRMALLQAKQTELIGWFADLLDGELWPERDRLEKVYFEAMGELENVPQHLLYSGCQQIGVINARRITLITGNSNAAAGLRDERSRIFQFMPVSRITKYATCPRSKTPI
jgi:hypothetical protein